MNNKVLWVTSFTPEFYEASGQYLLNSFEEYYIYGKMFVGYENFSSPDFKSAYKVNLNKSKFLENWLSENKSIIPTSLGGFALECNCPDPYARSEKQHKTRDCHHTWFNRNASKWFRKIATLYEVDNFLTRLQDTSIEYIIWIDSDCYFINNIPRAQIENWFVDQADVADIIYLKNKRPVIEAGFVGYNYKRGGKYFLKNLFHDWYGGRFRKLKRWDDSYVIQKAIECSENLNTTDLAYGVSKDHSGVFSESKLKNFIIHNKGLHGRVKGIMK